MQEQSFQRECVSVSLPPKMLDLFELDWATVLIFVASLVLVTGLTLGVAAFGAKEKTFEEALEEQKRRNHDTAKGKKAKGSGANHNPAKEAKAGKFKRGKGGGGGANKAASGAQGDANAEKVGGARISVDFGKVRNFKRGNEILHARSTRCCLQCLSLSGTFWFHRFDKDF